eukprot:gene5733-19453_t
MFRTSGERQRARAALFKEMKPGADGTLTFDKLLAWVLPHVTAKLAEVKTPGNKNNKYIKGYNGENIADLGKQQFKMFLYIHLLHAATTDPQSVEAKALRRWLVEQFIQAD